MKIANFNQTPLDRIKKMNDYLKENHGVKVTGFHTKNKLETVREKAEMHVVRLRNTNKKFNIDDYGERIIKSYSESYKNYILRK